jgi:hypothetical protein
VSPGRALESAHPDPTMRPVTGREPLLSLSDTDNHFKAAHSILLVEIQSIRAVATGSMARLFSV